MDITHDTIELQNGSDSLGGQGEREELLLSGRIMVKIGVLYSDDDRCSGGL